MREYEQIQRDYRLLKKDWFQVQAQLYWVA